MAFSTRHRNLKSTGRLEGKQTEAPPLHGVMDKGNAELKNKQFAAAIKCFKRVLRDEPSHLDAMYNRAICYMHLSQHKMAIPDLLTVSKENPLYDRQLYIALAMCFVAGGDAGTAVRQLTKGLSKYPKFFEGYLTRGQLLLQMQRCDKAAQDFYKAVTLDPHSGEAYLGLADCFRGLGEVANAVQAYSKAAEQRPTLIQALTRRSLMHQDLGQSRDALADLSLLLSQCSDHAPTYFSKAQLLQSLGEENEASLAFEQAIKYDGEEKQLTALAIYQLGLIKVRQRDFYGAMFTLRRARDVKAQTKDQQTLKLYAEAVLSLMKRKFKEAISLLSKLIKRKSTALAEFEASLFAYRGYGLSALQKHPKAVKDFRACQQLHELDNATSYNKAISQGIIAAEASDYGKALRYFDRAQQLFPSNMEPIAYKALSLLVATKSSGLRAAVVEEAKQHLDSALDKRPTEAELYFLRAALYYSQDQCTAAVPDLEQAIEKAEDNVPAHYLLRGLCYARLRLHQEALQDFSIAIQLDEGLAEAYFYRGRCAYLLEDPSLSFLDFQKLILAKQADPLVHVHAGNLLMLTGSFEDAAKAYSNANEIKPTALAYLQRCKCRLYLDNLVLALSDANKAATEDTTLAGDRDFLTALKDAGDGSSQSLGKSLAGLNRLQGTSGQLYSEALLNFYRGTWLLANQDYEKALHVLSQAAEEPSVPQHEVLFNLAMCCAQIGDYEKMTQLLEQVAAYLPQNRPQLMLLAGLARAALGEDAEEYLSKALELDDSLAEVLERDQVLSVGDSAWQTLPKLNWAVASYSLVTFTQTISLCCSLPRPSLPSFDFGIEDSAIGYFNMKALKSKPEAPWLNRVNGTIQFTEDMQMITSENVSDSEEAGLADLKEEQLSPDEDSAEEARKCQSAALLRGNPSSSGDLPTKRTEELLGKSQATRPMPF